jgi:hypothetical protein
MNSKEPLLQSSTGKDRILEMSRLKISIMIVKLPRSLSDYDGRSKLQLPPHRKYTIQRPATMLYCKHNWCVFITMCTIRVSAIPTLLIQLLIGSAGVEFKLVWY